MNLIRVPEVKWVDFLDIDTVRSVLSQLKADEKPVFGKMNGQQMVEHLSFLMQISNGKANADYYVSEEKSMRRKPFLDTDRELQIGFRAPMLSEEPLPAKFKTIEASIDDLVMQIDAFLKHFETVTKENHPFFGELNVEEWKKFHVKHFTHHFKQFDLIK